MYTIRVSLSARKDINQAMDWYYSINPVTSNKFGDKLYKQFALIMQYPEIKPPLYKKVHSAKLDGFPYSVHYIINKHEKRINIVGVFHTAVHPDNWKR